MKKQDGLDKKKAPKRNPKSKSNKCEKLKNKKANKNPKNKATKINGQCTNKKQHKKIYSIIAVIAIIFVDLTLGISIGYLLSRKNIHNTSEFQELDTAEAANGANEDEVLQEQLEQAKRKAKQQADEITQEEIKELEEQKKKIAHDLTCSLIQESYKTELDTLSYSQGNSMAWTKCSGRGGTCEAVEKERREFEAKLKQLEQKYNQQLKDAGCY